MSAFDVRRAILVSSYISSVTPATVVPEVVAPDLSGEDLSMMVDDLVSEGLIIKHPGMFPTMIEDRITCPYDLTDKGKGLLGFGTSLPKIDFSLFKIIVATGGSTVHNVETTTTSISVATFEQNLLKRIETSDHSDQEKKEAKSKLKEFLEHPLLSAALEAVLGAALKG